jgi:hypothetical protein
MKKAGNSYGIKVIFTKDAEGIISGQEAVKALKEFNYKGNSGARGLVRDGDGYWGAYWDYLDGSSDAGRVDFVCGEATQKNLEALALQDVDTLAKQELKRVEERINTAKKAYETALKA